MSSLDIFVGSVYGNAEDLARQVAQQLSAANVTVRTHTQATLSDFVEAKAVLVITSTTGQGDIPDNLLPLFVALGEHFPLMQQTPFAVVGLGDSSYGDTYCGAGEQWFERLTELQGKAIAPLFRVDACETLQPAEEVLPWLKQVKGDFFNQD